MGLLKGKQDDSKLAAGREAIEAFTSPTRCQGSYAEEAKLGEALDALGLSTAELRLLRIRLPRSETGVGTYAQRFARVRALLTEKIGEA